MIGSRKLGVTHLAIGLLLLLAFAYDVRSGFFYTGPSDWLDGEFFFVAGKAWARGASPYDLDVFHAIWRDHLPIAPFGSFVYPPTAVLLALPLAPFDANTAERLYDVANLAALIAVWGLGAALLRRARPETDPLLIVALIAATGFIAQVPGSLGIGQPGLFALLGILGAALCHLEQRPWLGAGFVALASVKPQLALIPLVYLFAAGGHRVVVRGVVVAALIAAAGTAVPSFEHAWHGYRESLQFHREMGFNQGDEYSSLTALLANFGVRDLALGWGVFLGAALAVVLGSRARASGEHLLLHLAVTLVLGLVFVPVHTYDWVLLVGAVMLLATARPRWAALSMAFAMVLLSRHRNIESGLRETLGSSTPLLWLVDVRVISGLLLLTVAPCVRLARAPEDPYGFAGAELLVRPSLAPEAPLGERPQPLSPAQAGVDRATPSP